jgi:PTH1 family peptidyl-tRNA hydrolase
VNLVAERGYHGLVARASVHGQVVWLLEPQTFMNLSGKALAPTIRFYKVDLSDVLVIHDELDLPFGRLQLKRGGGTGGHNGLGSIRDHLGTADFARLRVGIGKPSGPDAKERVIGHVLSSFGSDEEGKLDALFSDAADAAEAWVTDGLETAMNRFNRRSGP